MKVGVCAAAAAPLASLAFSASMKRLATSLVLDRRRLNAASAFCRATRLVTAMVAARITTTTSAVAVKILRVMPKPRGRSVPLTSRPAAVFLAVLVLVLDVLVGRGVHADVHVRES